MLSKECNMRWNKSQSNKLQVSTIQIVIHPAGGEPLNTSGVWCLEGNSAFTNSWLTGYGKDNVSVAKLLMYYYLFSSVNTP